MVNEFGYFKMSNLKIVRKFANCIENYSETRKMDHKRRKGSSDFKSNLINLNLFMGITE